MNISFLSLGSNLGNREEYLSKAKQLIEQKAGKILNCSSIYETEPWQFEGSEQSAVSSQNFFLNQVISLETQLSPIQLINCLLDIELSLGRKRNSNSNRKLYIVNLKSEGYLPRTIDLDILFYNDLILNEPELIIPHPLLHERRFVLLPLSEITPNLIHPVLKKTVNDLLKACKDNSEVKKFNS
jgi:deoxyguanosine kinase